MAPGEARAPDVDAFGRNKAQQNAAALPVLAGAFERIACGWVPTFDLHRWGNKPIPEGAHTLWSALSDSQVDPTMIDVEYARRLVRKLVGDFNHWSEHPLRTRDEVLQLLQKAIVLGGGEAPPMPRPSRRPHRGGWRIGGVH